MPDLIVTLIQSDLAWENIGANLALFDAKIDAARPGADLIILPEMFTTGFSMNAAALAEPMKGQAVTWLRAKAKQRKACIMGSLMIRERRRCYNRLVWAWPDGRMTLYDKKHLFAFAGEDKVYTAGRSRITLQIKGWRIRPFICYDLRFPIWTRNLNLEYDLAIFVANWPASRSAHWQTLLKARAIENQAYVIGVNRVGKDGRALDHDGHSALIAPTGEVLFEQKNKEIVHTVTLARGPLDDYRQRFPVWRDGDAQMLKSPPEDDAW
jgi:predicted amidohydrolase